MFRPCHLLVALFLFTTVPVASAEARSEASLWQALKRGEAIAIMRHALAPGTGDPARVVINNCSTQRNLSEFGREQARAIGALFRKNGIDRADVFTSQWCRCRDTARLLKLGSATDLEPLNSFFSDRDREGDQMAALKDWLAARKGNKPVVLVTHQVVITSLTGVFPMSGETVIFRRDDDGKVTVLGRIAPPK